MEGLRDADTIRRSFGGVFLALALLLAVLAVIGIIGLLYAWILARLNRRLDRLEARQSRVLPEQLAPPVLTATSRENQRQFAEIQSERHARWKEGSRLSVSEVEKLLRQCSNAPESPSGKLENETGTCPICLEEMKKSTREDGAEGKESWGTVWLPECNHAFHRVCARLFLIRGTSNRCPLCQNDIAVSYRGLEESKEADLVKTLS